MIIEEIQKRLRKLGNKQQAEFLQRYFKTGPGQYAEGDIFLGIRVPQLRKLLNEFKTITTDDALVLLKSEFHEQRLFALLLLVRLFSKADDAGQKLIYESYLDNTCFINNWDLVDLSSPNIVGTYLLVKNKKPLYKLAGSDSMWERRIAIMATFSFIKNKMFDDTLAIAGMLLADKEDLIHKASGWMLREIGKRDMKAEEAFLKKHCKMMPRTMLRYAIEKFPQEKRKMYMSGTIQG